MAKILLVDDSVAILRGYEVALQTAGHEVETATGPAEALRKIGNSVPDLMVVDVMMPGGTEGFDLVWEIRGSEDEGVRHISIIMATGIQDKTEMAFYPRLPAGLFEEHKTLDVQGWLDKPVRVAVLLEAIKSVLAG